MKIQRRQKKKRPQSKAEKLKGVNVSREGGPRVCVGQ